jgi:hypothetical protein
MQTLFLIGGWADGRFTAWVSRSAGRPEVLAAVGVLVIMVALWRIAERNERERKALTSGPRPADGARSPQGD